MEIREEREKRETYIGKWCDSGSDEKRREERK